jgi:predicted Zn finger-like uncharacterized protein
MDITCGDCGARFRLDRALLKEAKGVRVRCRRCGGKIVVHRPEAPSVLSADDVVPIDTGVPSAELKGGTSPAPDDGTAVGADLPGVILPDPALSPTGELTVPLSPVPVLDWRKAVAGEDTALPQPMPKADADLPPAPEEADPVEEIATPVPERKGLSGDRPFMHKYKLLTGMSILLLAGGTLYFVATNPGREQLGKFFPGWGSMAPGSIAENTIYDIRDVKWSFEKQTASGSLFVIKGKVANFGKVPSGGIGIRVTLLGKDNQALVGKTAFAGNFLDEASLRKMDRSGIAGAMSNRFGEGNVNKEIPPGNVLPFMVVFFDPPRGIEAVMVKAVNVQ